MFRVTNMLSLDETSKEIERLLALYGSLNRPDLIMRISADAKTVVEALEKLASAQKIMHTVDPHGVDVYESSNNLGTRLFYATSA
jgi:hypothetical protein